MMPNLRGCGGIVFPRGCYDKIPREAQFFDTQVTCSQPLSLALFQGTTRGVNKLEAILTPDGTNSVKYHLSCYFEDLEPVEI